MGSPNNHRSVFLKAEDFDKPWKIRNIGKWIKCAICSGKEWKRMTHHSKKKQMRRMKNITLINFE